MLHVACSAYYCTTIMNPFDVTAFNFIHTLAGRWFLLDWFAILAAVYVAYVLIVAFLVLVAKEKDKKKKAYALAWAALGMIISRGIITPVIYFFYQRPRPFELLGIDPVFAHAPSASFPSGHMAAYATLVLPVWYLNKKWGVIYSISVLAMGVARVYGAVHWPSDIIAGIVLALGVSYGVKRLLFGKEKEEASK